MFLGRRPSNLFSSFSSKFSRWTVPSPPPSRNEFQPALEPRNAAYTTGYAGKMLGSVFSWRKRVGKKKNKEGKKEKRGSPSFKSFIRKYEKNLGACKFLNSRLYTMLHPPSLYINPVAPVFHRFTASCSLNKPYCKRRWSRNPFSVTIEQRDGLGGEGKLLDI